MEHPKYTLRAEKSVEFPFVIYEHMKLINVDGITGVGSRPRGVYPDLQTALWAMISLSGNPVTIAFSSNTIDNAFDMREEG